MGKPAKPRVLSDVQAKAIGRNIRTSPRKLNLVAQSIRGQRAEAALATLTFSPKRVARIVKKVLESAIANAENNHDLDVDDLVVSEASVGKNLTMKRFHARARGRGGRIEKPFAQVTIVVEEKQESAEEKAAPAAKTQGKRKSAPRKSEMREQA
jgi:large subunit ribosomal protein L22